VGGGAARGSCEAAQAGQPGFAATPSACDEDERVSTDPPAPRAPGGAPDVVLDCRGRRCPLPILDLARSIGDVPVGGTIAVDADDAAAAHDIPAWCRMRSQRYDGAAAAADGTPRYLVTRLR